MRHAARQAADRLHALGVHQIRLGLRFLGQGVADALFQQFVDPLEVVLDPARVGHVESHADEADDLAARTEARTRKGLQPAVLPRAVAVARFKREGQFRGLSGKGLADQHILVVGVDVGAPVGGADAFVVAPHVFDVGLVDEGAAPILLRHPDQDRCGVGDVAETGLAFQNLGLGSGAFDLRPGPVGDVLDQTDLCRRPEAGAGRVHMQEGTKQAGSDDGGRDEGGDLACREGLNGMGGARVFCDIVDDDRQPFGQLSVHLTAELGDVVPAGKAGYALGPVPVHFELPVRGSELAVAHARDGQHSPQDAVDVIHDGLGIVQVAHAVGQLQQEALAAFLPGKGVQGLSGRRDVE